MGDILHCQQSRKTHKIDEVVSPQLARVSRTPRSDSRVRVLPGRAPPSIRGPWSRISNAVGVRSDGARSGGGMTPEKCEGELADIAKKTPMVRFLLEALDKAGCPVNRDFFEVQYCSQPVLGGFRPDQGVVLCHNNLMSRTDMENMLTHELVHAYDHCRNKHMNWLDVKQHACSEVRASNLSGDCHWVNEMFRGYAFAGFANGHQKCVRRRAELSTAMNPRCADAEEAKNAVDAVFAQCFKDTRPFDDIP
jgi:inner membrane protease ATP23